jgi:glycosyltransferase involved in cell wall biosynthesis
MVPSNPETELKILHVYRTYFPDPPGGLQEAIRQICLGTKAFGVESRVFTLSPQPFPVEIERPEGVVIRSRSWMAPASCDFGGFDALKQFKSLSAWADVIHYHFPWPFADLLNLFAARNKPKVMTYHSDIVRQKVLGVFYRPLMRYTLGGMDAVVATSPAYIETSPFLQSLVPRDRLRMIPLGIEDYFVPHAQGGAESGILERLNLIGREFVFALGVLRYYKGFHTLVEAAREIGIPIVIAGSGPEDRRLKDQARSIGADNVIFVGQVTDEEKRDLLRACSLLALPSHLRSEAFGMVLIEASMYAKPMVCCEVGSGTSFVNIDGETGFVVPPENPSELARAINTLIGSPLRATKMGQAARVRYEHLFSGEALGQAYLDLYREVIETRSQL